MKLKNKTRLNETELQTVLDLHNAVNDTLRSMSESFTCTLDQLSNLQIMYYRLQHLFNFKPPMCEHGHPQTWENYVLPNDPQAWFPDYEIEQMQEKETVQ
jgi:hypothetical protein